MVLDYLCMIIKTYIHIFAVDLSAQPVSSTTAEISIDVTRRAVPNASTITNPINLTGYFLYISDSIFKLNCIESAIACKLIFYILSNINILLSSVNIGILFKISSTVINILLSIFCVLRICIILYLAT